MEARPHGFRSSLRTWLAEVTDAPHEVAEAVLAHVSDSKVVRTYRQTDYLEQRRELLGAVVPALRLFPIMLLPTG